MGTGVKISLVLLGIVSIGALMAFAYYFGKQTGNPNTTNPISVTGEPNELPAVTEEVRISPTPEASPSAALSPTASPAAKLKLPNLRLIPSATPTPTQTTLKVNPNLLKQLQMVPSVTPTKIPLKLNTIPRINP